MQDDPLATSLIPAPPTPPTPPTIPLLHRLPPELIDHLLEHIPPQLLQRTALSLAQVFPPDTISARYVWKHLVVGRPGQLMPLWMKLKEEVGKGERGSVRHVKTFCQESWRGDADILNNVLRCLPAVRVLLLNIGTNFAPEHLEEMFEDPRPGIRRMEMRFRPYVEQASYYQFLKGSYFDTAIETLTRHWPETPSFTHLSIVQDLPPRGTAPPTAVTTAANSVVPSAVASAVPSAMNSALTTRVNSVASAMADLALESASTSDTDDHSGRTTPPSSIEENPIPAPVETKGYTGHGPFPYLSERMGLSRPKNFAQPIVFFDIKCIAAFGASPVAANLTHLRLRVPSRDLAQILVVPGIFPSLRYLDLSTTNVRVDAVFSLLLRSHVRLEHLVLDRVNLFGFMARDKGPELCHELGDKVVSAGLVRGKERERAIGAWELAERTRLAVASAARSRARTAEETDSDGDGDGDGDGGGSGSDGEGARAAIREAEAAEVERQRQLALSRARRGHRSAAHSTFSLRDRPARRGAASASTATGPSVPVPPPDTLYLVLPALPTIKTLCMGGEAHSLSATRIREWEAEYHAGWRDGLGKVLGWAQHIAERYERALRKADEWRAQEVKASTSAKSNGPSKGKGKAPASTSTKPAGTRPPTDIRLFRFPAPDEETARHEPSDPLAGLIEVFPQGRDYLDAYKLAVADSEIHANGQGPPACVLCTVPDCEGPARRGDEGARLDGRGGMGGKHRDGCGHLLGREIWGWNGV